MDVVLLTRAAVVVLTINEQDYAGLNEYKTRTRFEFKSEIDKA